MPQQPSRGQNAPQIWTPEEVGKAVFFIQQGWSYNEVAEELNRTGEGVRSKIRRIRAGEDLEYSGRLDPVPPSKYSRYDNPLVMEGDAIVLPDIELPFHNADFLNRCLDLADVWGIRKAVIAGDLMHWDSLSSWQANWINDGPYGLTERNERTLMDMAMRLPSKYQEEVISTIVSLDIDEQEPGSGVSKELANARTIIKILTEQFDEIDFVLGNHDDRFLRAIDSQMFPAELLRLVEAGDKWRVGPYYFSHLISNGEDFQIEHPKTWAKSSPIKLASKYKCHILQAHSHRWDKNMDVSGTYWAINMGCIVDEYRLPYASQRHGTADAHALGCVIVREGFPFLLSERTPWERYKKM